MSFILIYFVIEINLENILEMITIFISFIFFILQSKKAVKEARFVLELKQKAYPVQQHLAGNEI